MIARNGTNAYQAREMARGLASTVRAAVAAARARGEDVSALAWDSAAGVAELLELPGLVALLAACEAHAEAPPVAVANSLERLERLALESEAQGDIAPFAAADRELAALAGVLSAQSWAAPTEAEPTPEPVQALADLLADYAVDDAGAIARAQVTLPVAAGLHAALDWLGADAGGPLRVTVNDAALTLAARVTHEPGLRPAGAVLELLGGALLPEPDGRWALRVPLHALRPAFLLARQGELSVALPWHAVARLRIADDAARAVMTEPSLAPWSPLARVGGERPVVLLAQGLSRAWLHLDHIVWRVFAEAQPAAAPAAVPGARLAVRTEDGAEFWVVDVAEALRGVPQLDTPAPGARPRRTAAAAAVEPGAAVVPEALAAGVAPFGAEPGIAVVVPEPTPEPEPEPEPEPAYETGVVSRLLVLSDEHVRALSLAASLSTASARDVAPAPAPEAAAPDSAATSIDRALDIFDETRRHEPLAEPQPEPLPEALRSEPLEDASALELPAHTTIAELPEPRVLDPHDAQPLAASPQAPMPRRALIVDDSLVARLALAHLLDREGWAVEDVESAAEMWTALESGDWSVVFVDVFLPDASGRTHLRTLVARQLTARHRFEIVALTRDGAEQRLVDDAGITRALRKPFATGAVEGLIRDLPSAGVNA